jgi:hypothetical protein
LFRKAGAGDAVGKGRWSSGRSFEKSAHLLVESPVKRAFLSTIQAGLPSTLLFHDEQDECLVLTFNITFSLPLSLISGNLTSYIVHSGGKVNTKSRIQEPECRIQKVRGKRKSRIQETEEILNQNTGVRIQKSVGNRQE